MKKLAALFLICATVTASCASCGAKKSEEEKGIVGKWQATEDTLKSYTADEGDTFIFQSMDMELKDDKTFESVETADSTKLMALCDDKFVVQGEEMDVVSFDGEKLCIGKDGTTTVTFVRDEKSDDRYGKYVSSQFNEMFNADVEFNFSESGKSEMTLYISGTYTYDEKEKKIVLSTLDDPNPGEGDGYTVDLDGDTLTLTDSDGKKEVYKRK